MDIASPAFVNNGHIPSKYTCDGENINPALNISHVPDGAIALVLIVDDPDVPKTLRPDGMYVHWVVYNIDPKTRQIKEDSPSFGIEGKNNSGKTGYTGPCPPDREHRYFFKLYALDEKLPLAAGATKGQVEASMQGHIIEEAQLMGRYDRKRGG